MAHKIRFILMVLVIAAAPAAAQQKADDRPRPLDASVEDVGPLSVSLRDYLTDLRQPTGFEHVYRIGEQDDLLMRISGGLHAVFPRSVYADTRFGPLPRIPPGTFYFLGEPSREELMLLGYGAAGLPPPREDRSGLRLSSRIDAQPFDEGAADRHEPQSPAAERTVYAVPQRTMPPVVEHDGDAGPAARIISDPDYRSLRLRALMQRAAASANAAER
jgi:hypothetical protein